jgi:hypothetical protein
MIKNFFLPAETIKFVKNKGTHNVCPPQKFLTESVKMMTLQKCASTCSKNIEREVKEGQVFWFYYEKCEDKKCKCTCEMALLGDIDCDREDIIFEEYSFFSEKKEMFSP